MDQQPTRSGTHREPRDFDKTSLREQHHTHRISRDYLGHCVRWGFVRKFINHSTTVLDVGCGVDLPLLKTLTGGYANMIPAAYLGVDLNKLSVPTVKWATVREKFNFVTHYAELPDNFDVITAFELIEHMTVAHGATLLLGLKRCLAPGGTLLLSTPVFKKNAAKNHVHEYELEELRVAIEAAGLTVVKQYGTFANYYDIKRVATPEELAILERLNEFLHGDVTAVFMASLYPEASRNVTWIIRHAESTQETLGSDHLHDPEGC